MRLLLGAFPPELQGLLDHPPEGWTTACTGVGAITAAASTARLIEERHPEAVLFLGTCGHYDDRLRIGDLIAGAEALATSLSEARGEATRPGIETTRWRATLELPLKPATVAVPPAVTVTREGAALLARLAEAEHLELTGVYAACHAAGIPVGAGLAVVNEVGPEASAQWRANHAEGSRRLIEALRDLKVF